MELRDYQIEISQQALSILTTSGIVYLSMQTRTGKTITALQTAKQYGAKSILFVTKKKAIPGIEKDCSHFPTLSIVVINYESVHKVAGKYDLAILDEAHSLGQYPKPSNRYQALRKIVYNTPCILLSATPSPESFSQLFHQFTICRFHPWSRYPNFYKWAGEFVNKRIRYLYNREVNDYSEARKDMIDRDTKKYFIAFTQSAAGIINQVEEHFLHCSMNRDTSDLIQLLNKNKIVSLPTGEDILGDTPPKLMQKVQQLSSGTVIDETGKGHILDYSKARFIQQYFAGVKIAIFYKFKAELDLLSKVFTKHTLSPEEFQASEDLVFLAQFQSGREGIRLDTAAAIIFYNIDFSFLSYEQAKNRLVSKEREQKALLFWVFNKTGIEREIYEVVKRKENYTVHHYLKNYGRQNSA